MGIGTTEATEAESEEKETVVILLTPIPIPIFDLHWIVTLIALLIPSLVWTSPKSCKVVELSVLYVYVAVC